MYLDRKRELEVEQRKGSTVKTVFSLVWLAIAAAFAYFVTGYLFESETLTYPSLYNNLSLPDSVPNWVVRAGLIIGIVFVMEFLLLVGFAIVSPSGRRRPGTPSTESHNRDIHS